MKITVVGAGNVGATSADVLAYREIANEVVVVDIKRLNNWSWWWIYTSTKCRRRKWNIQQNIR